MRYPTNRAPYNKMATLGGPPYSYHGAQALPT